MTTVLAVTAACGTNTAKVDIGTDSGTVCAPAKVGQQRVIGQSFTAADDPITVTGVALKDAQGITVIDSFLLTNDDGDIAADVYPPPGRARHERKPAVGATVAAHESYNVVLHVERSSASTAHGAGIVISYSYPSTFGRRTSEVAGAISYLLSDDCAKEAG